MRSEVRKQLALLDDQEIGDTAEKNIETVANIPTTLTFNMRSDRMGRKFQLLLGVWSLANYYNVSRCTDHNDFVDPFHFKLCGATKRTATMRRTLG